MAETAMAETKTYRTPEDLAVQLETTAAVLRAEGFLLPAAQAAAIAQELRTAVATAIERIPAVHDAALQLDGMADLVREHGLSLPADLAKQLAAGLRGVADAIEGFAE
jgi:hypothetical protein